MLAKFSDCFSVCSVIFGGRGSISFSLAEYIHLIGSVAGGVNSVASAFDCIIKICLVLRS